MLDKIDTWLYERLRKIQHNNAPIPVHAYGPDREKGEFTPPCIAFERMYIRIDGIKARPTSEVPVAQEETTTIIVPSRMTQGEPESRVGPVRYTIKPYPTPVTVFYLVHALASKLNHANNLQLGLLQAFPPGYQPKINNQYPVVMVSDIENMDQLDDSLFESIVSLSVGSMWIDRLEGYEVDSIRFIDFDVDVENDSESEGI